MGTKVTQIQLYTYDVYCNEYIHRTGSPLPYSHGSGAPIIADDARPGCDQSEYCSKVLSRLLLNSLSFLWNSCVLQSAHRPLKTSKCGHLPFVILLVYFQS